MSRALPVVAPWQYHPTMDGGTRAMTIDEVPCDWCYQPDVTPDFRHCPDGYLVSGCPAKIRAASARWTPAVAIRRGGAFGR